MADGERFAEQFPGETRVTLSPEALALLDKVEALEMRSLAWGFTNGVIAESDLYSLANITEEASGESDSPDGFDDFDDFDDPDRPDDPDEAGIDRSPISELKEAGLLYEISSGGGYAYRSRFAELVRLGTANRQLFPRRGWRQSPTLVSDFRVDLRRRRFPKRDLDPASVAADLPEPISATPLRAAVWQALTAGDFRLAGFQRRALQRLMADGESGGTIITAGTGSGKTLAFYLPALLRVVDAVGPAFWTKVLAIYPRNELLKDQLSEVFGLARKLDAPLKAAGKRPLTLAALFGPTPRRASRDVLRDKKWERRSEGHVCPFLRCPECDAEMLWLDEAVDRGDEVLTCASPDCDTATPPDSLILTRDRMCARPPDLLFTTAEMLNRRLADNSYHPLLGVYREAGRHPLFALFDEVHTNEGVSGAQIAMTLRRWRHAVRAPVSWAGLSATLRDAPQFFADLTGLNADHVIEICPEEDEFDEEGAAYQLLLRGDPATRTSLLSTSIQSAMLIPRMLEPPDRADPAHPFGSRLFVFTDDLDVANRLYHDLQDAEGYKPWGEPDSGRDPLAALRDSDLNDAAKDVAGQVWGVSKLIKHTLTDKLRLDRTTSQDRNLAPGTQAVVATSALEVGYNDPQVGAVLQHKAPHSMASYVQRKGRAGRRRSMRPLMVTVLSAYGRDAAAFGAHEHLFDPTLDAKRLPVGNRYVLRSQAVFALFDWLSIKTGGPKSKWLWWMIASPRSSPGSERMKAVIRLLRALTTGEAQAIAELRHHLAAALSLPPSEVDALMWEGPRAVVLEAVPTLYRRLQAHWALAFPEGDRTLDIHTDNTPLPDFVPAALFADLSLPEVRIDIPAQGRDPAEQDALPIEKALTHLAPGRVTRRFAWRRGGVSHWMPLDPDQPEQTLRIADYALEYSGIGLFDARIGGEEAALTLPVYRPWALAPLIVDTGLAKPSSNARPRWLGSIDALGDGLPVQTPRHSRWGTVFEDVAFYLHRFQSRMRVRRFYRCADANLMRPDGEERRIVVRFVDENDGDAAIGYEMEVDGFQVSVDCAALDTVLRRVSDAPDPALRRAYLSNLFANDRVLTTMMNGFQREWLFQAALVALARRVAGDGTDADTALAAMLAAPGLAPAMVATLRSLLAVGSDEDDTDPDILDDEDSPRPAGGPTRSTRLQQTLEGYLQLEPVRARIEALLRESLAPDPEHFCPWLRAVTLETLGNALLDSALAASPAHATSDILVMDITHDAAAQTATLAVTETVLGGAGVLESFAAAFTRDPTRFFDALDAAIAPSDLETVDDSLRAILAALEHDEPLASVLATLRAATDHVSRAERWREFAGLLAANPAVDPHHAFAVSFTARMVHAESSPELDAMLRRLTDSWSALEGSLGLALAARDFACIAATSPDIAEALRPMLAGRAMQGDDDTISILRILLWPRAAELRGQALARYSPFRQGEQTDASLLRGILDGHGIAQVSLANPDWLEQTRVALTERGSCQLVCDTTGPVEERGDLRAAILTVAVTPVDVGVLQLYATLTRIDRQTDRLLATVEVREML